MTGSTPCATGSSAKSLPNPQKPYAVIRFYDGLIRHPVDVRAIGVLTQRGFAGGRPLPVNREIGALPTGSSGLIAVAEVYDAVTKAALVQQLELGVDPAGKGTLATTN